MQTIQGVVAGEPRDEPTANGVEDAAPEEPRAKENVEDAPPEYDEVNNGSAAPIAPSPVTPNPERGSIATDEDATTDIESFAGPELQAPLHSVFSHSTKQLVVTMTSLASVFSPLSSFIYLPAINTISDDLHVSTAAINLTVTSYMIFQGLAPMFFGDMSDMAGRRPAYLIAFTVYFFANIGLAVQNNYPALLVLRALQSTGSSGTVALGNGVIADIVTSAERGVYIGWVQLGTQLGPALAPTVGGILSQFLGWKAIFWFLVILGGIYLVVYFIFVPETSRNVVGDGSVPPQGWNMSLLDILRNHKARKGRDVAPTVSQEETTLAGKKLTKKRRIFVPNPLRALRIIVEKDVALILFFTSLLVTGFYCLSVPSPSIFKETRGFSDLQIGLCFIPFSVGSGLGGVCCGRFLDYNYTRVARQIGVSIDRKRGHDLREFPIERARLGVVWYPMFLGCCSIIAWGWALHLKVHLAVPLVVLFFAGFFLSGSTTMLNALLVDLYPQNPATAMAALNLTRCSMGAAGTAMIELIIDKMGVGWTYTFIGLVIMAASPCLWVVMKWGPGWREARFIRETKKAEEREEKKKTKYSDQEKQGEDTDLEKEALEEAKTRRNLRLSKFSFELAPTLTHLSNKI